MKNYEAIGVPLPIHYDNKVHNFSHKNFPQNEEIKITRLSVYPYQSTMIIKVQS